MSHPLTSSAMAPEQWGVGTISVMVALAAAVWGLYWVPLRQLDAAGLGPAWAAVFITAVPLPLIAWFAWYKRAGTQVDPKQILIVGFCVGGGMLLYAFGLVYSSVIRATLLFYLTPIWGTFIGWLWLQEFIGVKRWVAIALGLIGLVALLNPGAQLAVPLNIGDAFGLASGVLWAIGSASLKRYRELPLHLSLGAQYSLAVVLGVTLALWLEPLPGGEIVDWTNAAWISAGFGCLVILPTLYALMWCAQRIAPGRLGLLMMSEVVVAVVSAALFLPQETLSIVEWAGVVLIICAGVVEVRTRDAKAVPEST